MSLHRVSRLHSTCSRLSSRHFSTSFARFANRAVVYTDNGSPQSVLSVVTYPSLPAPPPHTINVRYLLAPINPADVNVVEGVYPAKPTRTALRDSGDSVFVGGNEGLAEVTGVGEGVEGVKVGEWVVSGKQQCGTWRSSANLEGKDVIKVPKTVSEVAAATITVSISFLLCEQV